MIESNHYENITNFQNIMASDLCQYKKKTQLLKNV